MLIRAIDSESLNRVLLDDIQGLILLHREIRLSLLIAVPADQLSRIGDLDNFITGVCDGLMRAHPRGKLDAAWNHPSLSAVHPSRTLAIVDDREIVSITAEKRSASLHVEPSYEISLDGQR